MKLQQIFILKKRNWKKMPEAFSHREEVLQQIWKGLLFDFQHLHTQNGQPVKIIDPGTLNSSDGPDFMHAILSIGGREYHGSVEIHVRASEWNQHGHHRDANYNKVILHVVAQDKPLKVSNEQGASVPTLNLLPHLNEDTRGFLQQLDTGNPFPCTANVSYISEEALDLQIRKAHLEYLEKKVNDLLKFYDADLIPSDAWKKALIISVFDGFGIPHNREAMQEAGRIWWDHTAAGNRAVSARELKPLILQPGSGIRWQFKGVHPVGHPRNALIYAAGLSARILEMPFKSLLLTEDLSIWKQWVRETGIQTHYKAKILYATVFLPAMYLLGSLYHREKLMKMAASEWFHYRVSLPPGIQEKLQFLGRKGFRKHRKTLGSVHHLRAYCDQRNCHRCEVLKKVISS